MLVIKYLQTGFKTYMFDHLKHICFTASKFNFDNVKHICFGSERWNYCYRKMERGKTEQYVLSVCFFISLKVYPLCMYLFDKKILPQKALF